MIKDEIKDFKYLTYKDYFVYELNNSLISNFKLEKVSSDSDNWRTYYKTSDSNWLAFYPFSAYHGGGQQYIIMLETTDCDKWIEDNFNFENEIRKIIDSE